MFKHESVAVEKFRCFSSFTTKFFIEKAVFSYLPLPQISGKLTTTLWLKLYPFSQIVVLLTTGEKLKRFKKKFENIFFCGVMLNKRQ